MNNLETPNYPVNAFPPKLASVIWEQFYNNEGPLPMIGSSVITALSTAISYKADVEMFPGTATPTIVNTWVVAGSGSRKSFIDRMIGKVFRSFASDAVELMKSQIAARAAEILVWKAAYDRINKKLRGNPSDAEGANVDDDGNSEGADLMSLQEELENLLANKPHPLFAPKIIYKDATREAIAIGLSRWPAALLNSAEAASVLKGRTMSDQGFFNERWDGDDLVVDRASLESFCVIAPRLTVAFMVQEKPFWDFLIGKGRMAEDIGFLARFLMCFPTSLEGTRFNANSTGSWEHLENFHARIREILMTWLPEDGETPPRILLKLSSEARMALQHFSNLVELDLAPGGYLSELKGHGSKAGEQVVRLAALFHYHQGFEGDISAETLQRAISIVSWHLEEAKRILGTKPDMPLELRDAAAVDKTIRTYLSIRPGQNHVPKSYLFSHCPQALRNKARLDMALQVLVAQNFISLQRINKKTVVMVNPVFYPSANLISALAYPVAPPQLNIGYRSNY